MIENRRFHPLGIDAPTYDTLVFFEKMNRGPSIGYNGGIC